MNKTIYMVEDEKSLNVLLKKYLENEGYIVTAFFDGTSAEALISDLPDLWVLDIMLPDTDGYELIKKIKAYNSATPVIFMSARNEELDRVLGLELGSDDYLSKPFLPRELVIRVNKLIERIYGSDASSNLQLCGYEISEGERSAKENGTEITLSSNEFTMLLMFFKNPNIVFTRNDVLNKVWGDGYFGSDRVVDDTIRRLRKKLPNINICTVYGYGYKLAVK